MRSRLGPVRWWVRFYTAGLEPSVRDRRREEIHSDLADQIDAGCLEGRSPTAMTATIWLRSLTGMLDDVLWRREQPRVARVAPATVEGSGSMVGSGTRGSLVVPVVGIVVAIAVAVTVLVIDNIQYFEQSQRFVASDTLITITIALFALGIASVVVGFVLMGSRPGLGAALAVGGSAVAGLMVYWLILPLLIAAALSVYAVRRARRIAAAGSSS